MLPQLGITVTKLNGNILHVRSLLNRNLQMSSESRTIILLVSRFNVRMIHFEKQGKTPGEENYNRWLKNRVEIFEEFTLPSVQAQSDSNFLWVILFDKSRTPEWLHDRIHQWQSLANLYPYFIEGNFSSQKVGEASTHILEQEWGKNADWLGTGWFDTDDLIFPEYVQRLRANFGEKEEALCFPRGRRVSLGAMRSEGNYKADAGFRLSKVAFEEIYWPKSTTAITRFEKVDFESKPKTVYQLPHHRLQEVVSVRDISIESPAFIKLVHDSAIVNTPERYPGLK